MKISSAGVKLIANYEGLRLKAYWDAHGKLWTIGYGHTATAKEGMKITKEQALNLLARDLERFEKCVEDVINVALTQEQFDALVSFAFNRGCNGFRKSSVVELVNSRRFSEAADVWKTTAVTAGGKRLAGLVKRRKAESEMFAGRYEGGERNLAGWLLFGSAKAAIGRAT